MARKRQAAWMTARGQEHKHWIPVTPVITAIGCDDWGDENDGGRRREQALKSELAL